MNEEVKNIVDWLRINKLSINLKKTHFMIFRKKRQKLVVDEELIINNIKIDQVKSTKFLGVVIDHHLTFQQHILYLKGKISRGLPKFSNTQTEQWCNCSLK